MADLTKLEERVALLEERVAKIDGMATEARYPSGITTRTGAFCRCKKCVGKEALSRGKYEFAIIGDKSYVLCLDALKKVMDVFEEKQCV